MAGEYRLVNFGDICEHSAFGPRFSSTEYASDGNVACLRTMDMDFSGRINFDAMPLAKLDLSRLRNHILRRDDLVITRTGAYLGKAAVFSQFRLPVLAGAFSIYFRLNREIAYPIFVRYFFNSAVGQAATRSVATGSAQPNVNIPILHSLQVPLPSLQTQHKIASILSAYDDLIENNTRRIAILEEMAQAIYREWFVNFRFPGHENVKLVESALCKIPEGWEVKVLGDIAEVNARSIKKDNTPDNINYIDIASVSTGRIDEIRPMAFSDAPGRARRIVRHGDVIWSTVRPNRKSYCVILEPSPDTIASTGFAVLSAKAVPFSYLYFAVTTDDFSSYLVNHATGSAYPAVNSKDFVGADVILPPEELLDKFHNIVGETLLLGQRLLRKNKNLRTTRDLLLPKLISGQLDVEDLDIDVGMTAEELTEAAAG